MSSINNVIERGVEKEEPIFPEPLSLYTVFQYFPAALIHDGWLSVHIDEHYLKENTICSLTEWNFSFFFFYIIGWMRFKDSFAFAALIDCLYILCILFILYFFCFEIVDGSLSSSILVCEDGYSCPNLAADPEPNLFFLASGSSQLYVSWIVCCRSQH